MRTAILQPVWQEYRYAPALGRSFIDALLDVSEIVEVANLELKSETWDIQTSGEGHPPKSKERRLRSRNG